MLPLVMHVCFAVDMLQFASAAGSASLASIAALVLVVLAAALHYTVFWYRIRNGVPVATAPIYYPFGNIISLMSKGSLGLVLRLQGTVLGAIMSRCDDNNV